MKEQLVLLNQQLEKLLADIQDKKEQFLTRQRKLNSKVGQQQALSQGIGKDITEVYNKYLPVRLQTLQRKMNSFFRPDEVSTILSKFESIEKQASLLFEQNKKIISDEITVETEKQEETVQRVRELTDQFTRELHEADESGQIFCDQISTGIKEAKIELVKLKEDINNIKETKWLLLLLNRQIITFSDDVRSKKEQFLTKREGLDDQITQQSGLLKGVTAQVAQIDDEDLQEDLRILQEQKNSFLQIGDTAKVIAQFESIEKEMSSLLQRNKRILSDSLMIDDRESFIKENSELMSRFMHELYNTDQDGKRICEQISVNIREVEKGLVLLQEDIDGIEKAERIDREFKRVPKNRFLTNLSSWGKTLASALKFSSTALAHVNVPASHALRGIGSLCEQIFFWYNTRNTKKEIEVHQNKVVGMLTDIDNKIKREINVPFLDSYYIITHNMHCFSTVIVNLALAGTSVALLELDKREGDESLSNYYYMAALGCDFFSLMTSSLWQGVISHTVNNQKEQWQRKKEVLLKEGLKMKEKERDSEPTLIVNTNNGVQVERRPLLPK